jgi:(E)-4-hydroxy-3-methylbut-2-enyl-diphosphate synthase
MKNPVKIGGFARIKPVFIGAGQAVVIQTMWKDRLAPSDIEGSAGAALIRRIEKLGAMGCGLLRFAAPDTQSAETLGRLAEMTAMPLVADIHFDYRIALRCLDFPIAKIRINPGNIGARENVRKVVEKAGAKGAPIRIGVNAGSLPLDLKELADAGKMSLADALVQTAERELAVFETLGFDNVIISAKASSIADTIQANTLLKKTGVPLHVGVTEAGPLIAGTVRSTVALCALLNAGVGDTIRVSLSDTVENEVITAREILNADAQSKGKKPRGATIISCPRCGRNSFDTHRFTEKWADRLYALDKAVTIAVMGCAVNGPGEARQADIGITGVGDKVLLFKRGEIVKTIDKEDADAAFNEMLATVEEARQ